MRGTISDVVCHKNHNRRGVLVCGSGAGPALIVLHIAAATVAADTERQPLLPVVIR